MEYPILYLKDEKFVWGFSNLLKNNDNEDDNEINSEIVFRPYIPILRKKETKATIIEKLPSLITSDKAYLDATPNETVTVVDLNPQDDDDDQFCAEYGWCKIRIENGLQRDFIKYYLISFLKFKENF
ncbi:hypothetical protein M9Y10_038024 [Tritrichomonas musculus]|uniref:SH3 domain-containing protein n=1 Tax=Tritrichomonas musculus TaxID=1915356 RepID=A0ABR2K7F7_9EUKA